MKGHPLIVERQLLANQHSTFHVESQIIDIGYQYILFHHNAHVLYSDWDYHAPRAIVALPDKMVHFHIKTLRHTRAFVF